MKWVGLTGGIATGKSTVAKVIQELGFPVIDADLLAREAVLPGSEALAEIAQKFGSIVLSEDGTLDRKVLSQIVFGSPEKLAQLEEIIHPEVKKLTQKKRRELETKGVKLAFYDVPLLFEKHLEDQFDEVVVVYSPVNLQRERLKLRDGFTDEEVDQRVRVQLPIEEKAKRTKWVIDNTQSLAELKSAVKSLVLRLQ